MTKVMCERCKQVTEHKHLHNTAHGIPETHMAGSERYECVVCGHPVFKDQAQGLDLKFVLD